MPRGGKHLKLKEALKKAKQSGEEEKVKKEGYFLNSCIAILPVDSYKISGWILTYYNPSEDKVIQFLIGDSIVVKEAEKPINPTKKELNVKDIKTSVEKMLEKARREFARFKKPLSQVIITIQETEEGTVWKFNFITKTLEIVIIEIEALNGGVISTKTVNLTKKE